MTQKLFTKAWRRKLREELSSVGYMEGTWNPQLTTISSGMDIFFETSLSPNISLSNDNHTATLTDPGTEGVSGGYFTNQVFDAPLVDKYGFPVTLPEDPSAKPNNTISLYLMIVSGNVFPPDTGMTAVIGVDAGAYVLYALGNAIIEDWLPEVNIVLDWTPTTQYTVAYDPTVGSYGAVYFYQDAALIASYVLTVAPAADLTHFAVYGAVTDDSWAVTIENTPAVSISGVTYAGGTSTSFINNWPADRAGKSFAIAGLGSEGLDIPGFGFVYNDDVIFFDANGIITASL